ncbi:prolyl-tRNA synthetase associated domain-containing protein [Roseomonas sp. GC11]|uniref:prolyl-tRNA synthetase associated domain-containing protein n=1 Tax=Roseomonas sp. GC11 TaxID=2950546 RepID=UPI00210C0487|nr:prolyl-tRNA synthetase associated domain-containing protein [Roseomonas sp. GC11]MCQ4161580.1 prolyl-tRNA synthetase associated domain-containing protein [Roseomonas sp. GC11]
MTTDLPPLASGRPAETPEGLLARLAAEGIATETLHHPPFFTVADGAEMHHRIPGLHVKNLFLKPKGEGPFLLLVLEAYRRVPVNALVRSLGVARASFAAAEDLWVELGVLPGSVTPLALVNSVPGRVRIAIDRMLLEAERINMHPLVNTASTVLAPGDLLRFLREMGHAPEALEIP